MTIDRITSALTAPAASTRLRAALDAGTHPCPELLDALLARCAVEDDFFVRDMLTWAITRLPPETTLPALLVELDSPSSRARSQALHTLSKLADQAPRRIWAALTDAHLHDPDDEVARTAWRLAAAVAPPDESVDLARRMLPELGRGDTALMRSFSRAMAQLGESAAHVLRAVGHPHARATLELIADPEADITAAIEDARRVDNAGPWLPC